MQILQCKFFIAIKYVPFYNSFENQILPQKTNLFLFLGCFRSLAGSILHALHFGRAGVEEFYIWGSDVQAHTVFSRWVSLIFIANLILINITNLNIL